MKAPNGKPSELQKWNIKKINEANGIGVILYPDQFDDFKELVWWLKNADWYKARKIMHKINERWGDVSED